MVHFAAACQVLRGIRGSALVVVAAFAFALLALPCRSWTLWPRSFRSRQQQPERGRGQQQRLRCSKLWTGLSGECAPHHVAR